MSDTKRFSCENNRAEKAIEHPMDSKTARRVRKKHGLWNVYFPLSIQTFFTLLAADVHFFTNIGRITTL